jgi:hypothetical protein
MLMGAQLFSVCQESLDPTVVSQSFIGDQTSYARFSTKDQLHEIQTIKLLSKGLDTKRLGHHLLQFKR